MKLIEKTISIIPIYGPRYFKRKAAKEIKAGEAGIVYNAPGQNDPDGKKFKEFLTKLPNYQVEDNFFASRIRALMRVAGTEYKQVVLIDKANIHDKKLWVRVKGLTLVHGEGTYFYPWEGIKDVNYWDIVDSRPLIDMTKDMDWYNPEMCAEVVTAITNTKAMGSWGEDSIEKIQKMIMFILIAVGIGIAVSVVLLFQQNQANTNMMEILKKIAERIIS